MENVLVKVDRFLFSVDFVILDMDEDSKVPFILGRPFLSTSRGLDDTLYYIDTIEPLIEENIQGIFEEDLFDTNFIRGADMNTSSEEVHIKSAYLIKNDPFPRSNKDEDIKRGTGGNSKTSYEEPLVRELKDLPPYEDMEALVHTIKRSFDM
nr:hypothetical protein [Tanacetum cinerariifolium]